MVGTTQAVSGMQSAARSSTADGEDGEAQDSGPAGGEVILQPEFMVRAPARVCSAARETCSCTTFRLSTQNCRRRRHRRCRLRPRPQYVDTSQPSGKLNRDVNA